MSTILTRMQGEDLEPISAISAPESPTGESQISSPSPVSTPLLDLAAPSSSGREAKNLLGDGFLRRGQTGFINGPTGVGKSSMTMQAALRWATGNPFFGIRPQGPLRVLIVQSENDDDDLAEMRDGILAKLNIPGSSDPVLPGILPANNLHTLAHDNVRVLRSFSSGAKWLMEIKAEVEQFRPDILIVDPFFAYCGVDVAKDQPGLSKFLREMVLPFTLEHNLGLIFVHHTNKPPTLAKDRSTWTGTEFAYAGSGHNELANFPRFVAVLRAMGSKTVFELRLGKRWRRAGILDADGIPTDKLLIKHSEQGISWDPATEAELSSSVEQGSQQGRLAKNVDAEAEKIFRCFFANEADGAVPLNTLARKLKTSEKTVRRRFGSFHKLSHKEDMLELKDSVIRLVESSQEVAKEIF